MLHSRNVYDEKEKKVDTFVPGEASKLHEARPRLPSLSLSLSPRSFVEKNFRKVHVSKVEDYRTVHKAVKGKTHLWIVDMSSYRMMASDDQ